MKEKIIRAVAGTIVLISIVLAYYLNPGWIWMAVFVGVNLVQSTITSFCPLEKILDRVGVK